jgi:hypothetical protein
MRLLFSSLALIGHLVIGTLVPQAAHGRHQREVTIVMLPRIEGTVTPFRRLRE